MVSIGYEPVEHLPYIAENISPEERANVEQLLRLELANQFNSYITTFTAPGENTRHLLQHPQTGTLQHHIAANPVLRIGSMPSRAEEPSQALHFQTTMLDMNIHQYEEESDDGEDEIMNEGGVDSTYCPDFPLTSPLEQSSSIGGDDALDSNLYIISGRTPLQQGDSNILIRLSQELQTFHLRPVTEVDNVSSDLMSTTNIKRKTMDEVNGMRKKRQLNSIENNRESFQQHWRQELRNALNVKEAKKTK